MFKKSGFHHTSSKNAGIAELQVAVVNTTWARRPKRCRLQDSTRDCQPNSKSTSSRDPSNVSEAKSWKSCRVASLAFVSVSFVPFDSVVAGFAADSILSSANSILQWKHCLWHWELSRWQWSPSQDLGIVETCGPSWVLSPTCCKTGLKNHTRISRNLKRVHISWSFLKRCKLTNVKLLPILPPFYIAWQVQIKRSERWQLQIFQRKEPEKLKVSTEVGCVKVCKVRVSKCWGEHSVNDSMRSNELKYIKVYLVILMSRRTFAHQTAILQMEPCGSL